MVKNQQICMLILRRSMVRIVLFRKSHYQHICFLLVKMLIKSKN